MRCKQIILPFPVGLLFPSYAGTALVALQWGAIAVPDPKGVGDIEFWPVLHPEAGGVSRSCDTRRR